MTNLDLQKWQYHMFWCNIYLCFMNITYGYFFPIKEEPTSESKLFKITVTPKTIRVYATYYIFIKWLRNIIVNDDERNSEVKRQMRWWKGDDKAKDFEDIKSMMQKS